MTYMKRRINKLLLLILFSSFLFGKLFSQEGTFKDKRDGKVYKTIIIGDQTWMQKNLNVETFLNGDTIKNAP